MLIESLIGGVGRTSLKVDETATPLSENLKGKVSPILEKKREEASGWDIEIEEGKLEDVKL